MLGQSPGARFCAVGCHALETHVEKAAARRPSPPLFALRLVGVESALEHMVKIIYSTSSTNIEKR